MKQLFILPFYFLINMVFVTVSMYASDETEKSQYIQAGTRAKSLAEHLAIQEKRVSEIEKIEQKALSQKSNAEMIASKAQYLTSHVDVIHFPFRLWEYNEKIELNDGTIWTVALKDRWKLSQWLLSDAIVIFPNHYIFSTYNYILANQVTGDHVDVNLEEIEILPTDPTFYGYRHWIVQIDHFSNTMLLEDGSIWKVTLSDDSLIQKWFIGDIVIIGINDSWESLFFPNILINFATCDYARVNCIN